MRVLRETGQLCPFHHDITFSATGTAFEIHLTNCVKKRSDAISAAVAQLVICHKSTSRMGNTAVTEQSDLDL